MVMVWAGDDKKNEIIKVKPIPSETEIQVSNPWKFVVTEYTFANSMHIARGLFTSIVDAQAFIDCISKNKTFSLNETIFEIREIDRS